MGKGNRSRTERAVDAINTPVEGNSKNTKRTTIIVTAIVCLLLVACIALSLVANTGIVLRAQTAAQTDHYSVSGLVMSYFIQTTLQSYLSYFGNNQSYSYLQSITYDAESGLSLFDFAVSAAVDEVQETLLLCEYARAEGIKLTDEQKKEIDDTIDEIATYAAQNLYSVSGYISAIYGPGMTANDIREALELSYLATSAYEHLTEKLEEGITDELMDKYFEDHPNYFLTVDYLSYTFTASLAAKDATATDEEKAAFEKQKADMAALAAKLAEVADEDAFKAFMLDYLVNTVASDSFKDAYEKEAKSLKDDEKPSEETLAADKATILSEIIEELKALDKEEEEADKEETDKEEEEDKKEEEKEQTAYEKALSKTKDTLLTSAKKSYQGLKTEGYSHYDPEAKEISDLDKWFFASDRKVGDIKSKTDGDTADSKKVTYTVYYLTETSHRDESDTHDVSHILVSFDDYKKGTTITDDEKKEALKKAEEILAQYKGGELTHDAFVALGEKETADGNVTYENVYEGQMVEEFEDWLFDDARKVGDVEIVETTYGYHIMYYVGEGLPVWKSNAYSGVLSDKFNDWLEQTTETYDYTLKESLVNSIANSLN